ncbi:MAG: DUF3857 domain-containing protein [Bacteroidetes bacterium]|nr:DUF3857 domain-containing protein [Bacteroidota bacterium]
MKQFFRSVLLFLVVGFCSKNLMGQGHGFPFGVATMSELQMTHYPLDSSASAVVLDEFGEVYFDYNEYKMYVEVHRKIKILKKEGFEKADLSILLWRYERRDAKLELLEGKTHYLENGKIRNSVIDKKTVFYEKHPDYYLAKFALPNAMVGSIIEFRYIVSGYPNYKLYPWQFQSDIPKVRSEFWAEIPANFVYHASLQGFLKLSLNESSLVKACFSTADCSLLKFGIKDIPAFKTEEYMADMSNYKSAINFELSEVRFFDGRVDRVAKEWRDVEEELDLNEDFGVQIKKAKSIFKTDVEALTAGMADPLEKAKKIYGWMKAQFMAETDFIETKFAANGAAKTFETKKGNEADINLCLVGALQSIDLNAQPLILSTRDNGFPNRLYPTQTDYNYVVAHLSIGESIYLLDATDDYLSFGLIPEKCLNDKGRLLIRGNPPEIDLTPKAKQKSITTLNLKINEEGGMSGTVQVNSIDYSGVAKRKEINAYSNRQDYLSALSKKWTTSNIKNYDVVNLEDVEKPLMEKMEISFDANGASNTKQIYLNPFLRGGWSNNPFKSKDRMFPVDFGKAQEEVNLINIEYPANYQLEEIPKNVLLTLPNKGGKFFLNYSNVGNKLNISFSLSLTKSVYDATEYQYLRELYSQIIQLRQTDLVLVKKN